MKRSLCLLLAAAGVGLLVAAEKSSETTMETRDTPPPEPAGKVEKTDAEWRKLLTPAQYEILRKAGTERPNGKIYEEFKKQGKGTYHCAGCGAELFSSAQKFDSHCGWPSFYDPSKAQNVEIRKDLSLGMVRTEVICAKCGGHLGHVFEGEGFDTPTDKRYCINGAGLVFVPTDKAKPKNADDGDQSGDKSPVTPDTGPEKE